eukprot:1710588-Prymnesium_polylepis.1
MTIRDAQSCSLDVGAPRQSTLTSAHLHTVADVCLGPECRRLHWRCVTRRLSTATALTLFEYMRLSCHGPRGSLPARPIGILRGGRGWPRGRI